MIGLLDWRWVFIVPFVMGLILAVSLIILPLSETRQKHVGNIKYIESFRNPSILKVFLFIFMISFFYHGVHKWYGVYFAQEYLLDKFSISLFFIIFFIGGFIC